MMVDEDSDGLRELDEVAAIVAADGRELSLQRELMLSEALLERRRLKGRETAVTGWTAVMGWTVVMGWKTLLKESLGAMSRAICFLFAVNPRVFLLIVQARVIM